MLLILSRLISATISVVLFYCHFIWFYLNMFELNKWRWRTQGNDRFSTKFDLYLRYLLHFEKRAAQRREKDDRHSVCILSKKIKTERKVSGKI